MEKPKIRFELFTDGAGEFRFRIVAANNEIVATSEGYKNAVDRAGTIQLIAGHALTAPIVKSRRKPAKA